jgi:two-component system cell cycle sensor histidine kinase/response regulator CckA
VAHDFNNLLTVINGYSALALQRLGEKDSLRPALEEIQRAGERAAELTGQLVAFSRKQARQPKPVNLNIIVSENEGMLRRLLGEDVLLVTCLDSALGLVTVDPGQMHQVLMNLAANARDAMPQGGEFRLETTNVDVDPAAAATHEEATPGPYVMLRASDTGAGMDEDTRRHLFEPFFTTKEVGKGTGLGLATVYGIVRQSQGYIEVDSGPGRGAIFQIYLPRTTAVVQSQDAGANSSPGHSNDTR